MVRFGLAGATWTRVQADLAAAEYAEAVPLKPDYSAAHRGLGRALERAGRPAEAVAAYTIGLEVASHWRFQTGKEIEVSCGRLTQAGM